MNVKIIKDEKTIKIFLDDKEVKNIKSFNFQRDESNIEYFDLNIKVLTKDIIFEDKTNREV